MRLENEARPVRHARYFQHGIREDRVLSEMVVVNPPDRVASPEPFHEHAGEPLHSFLPEHPAEQGRGEVVDVGRAKHLSVPADREPRGNPAGNHPDARNPS